ncbi:hypothetical protein [Nocardia sp. NPDC003963]
MSGPTKSLLFTAIALTAVIVGAATAFLSKADGATVPATVRAGAIGFGASLTLFMAVLTAYMVV